MPRSTKLLLLILGWFAAELITLSVLVKAMGWLGVIAVGILTTLLGFALIRSLGRSAVQTLQAGMQDGTAAKIDLLAGSLRAAAAILLIVPGFLTDAIGLLMLSPGLGAFIAGRFGPRPAGRDGTIDLDRHEWRPIDPESGGRLEPPDRRG